MILAFDTATPSTALGCAAGERLAERHHHPADGERPGHTAMLLRFAHEAMAEIGARLGPGDRVAVGVGPGSFTGLRIGIAAARALAQGSGAELAGFSSLRALALGHRGTPVVAAIDARRGECFVARFDADGDQIEPARAIPAPELAALPAGGLAVGDGAVRYATELRRAGLEVPAARDAHLIRARDLVALAADADAVPVEDLLPDYVRAPDATPR